MYTCMKIYMYICIYASPASLVSTLYIVLNVHHSIKYMYVHICTQTHTHTQMYIYVFV